MHQSKAVEKFVLKWGEMGARWGVNRTVAQIHALLYLSPEPINAEEIAHHLSLARSNVSNSLKELQSWGIVKIVHKKGDRRDHFECVADVWKMFQIVLDERKKREIDPLMDMLEEGIAETKQDKSQQYATTKLQDMLSFFKLTTSWYADMKHVPVDTLYKLIKLGSKVQALFGGKKKH